MTELKQERNDDGKVKEIFETVETVGNLEQILISNEEAKYRNLTHVKVREGYGHADRVQAYEFLTVRYGVDDEYVLEYHIEPAKNRDYQSLLTRQIETFDTVDDAFEAVEQFVQESKETEISI